MINTHTLGELSSLHLAQVTDNNDPQQRGRVKVRLYANRMEVWASVIVPSAGNGYGVSFVPKLDETVVIAFATPEAPFVLGSIWSGGQSAPDEAQQVENKYVIKTPADTVLEFDDSNEPKVEIRTRQGYKLTINEGAGGEIDIVRGSQRIHMTTTDITIEASSQVNVRAAMVQVDASQVTVNAAMSMFSGVVQCQTLMATSVISSSYTPGAGNIW